MTPGEIAYLALVLLALVMFIAVVGYGTWCTEGAPGWLRRSPRSAPRAERAPATATPAR
jgi:hypothetical protein